MATNPNREWLSEELPRAIVQAFEAMAGVRPESRVEDGGPPVPAALLRRQAFTGLSGSIWLAAAEPDWMAAGNEVLRAAGIEDGDPPTLKSTYFETIGQAFSALAGSITRRIARETLCAPPLEGAVPPSDVSWTVLRLTYATAKVHLSFAFDAELIEQLTLHQQALEPASETDEIASAAQQESASKTFDLLLDVELPVSVSFGRAQVQLKELIKLTTGSIVELNRSISEPVEVIVNNCVIARGEVVVVEGNFGVRIQQVVSRQERLRTLS
jgi:flagellar motor switch protein FliN/FliY